MKLTVPDHISSITPYSPGKPLEELEREYGIRDPIKLASNENPLGPSPMAAAAIPSLDAWMDDVGAGLDAAGARHAAILGDTEGGPPVGDRLLEAFFSAVQKMSA